jgi:hypothetical protein
VATSPDYPVLGRPRISLPGFAAVLRSNGSPAAAEASAEYNAIAAAGVDPAVALAIFRKESTFGKFGRANRNRSWGNIRGGTAYPLDDSRFRIYPSWTAGAADIGRLLAIYGANRIRAGTKTDTVQTLPYVWAPSSDGNAPDAYGDSLARWIGEWSAKYPASGSGSGATVSVNADLASTEGCNLAAKLGKSCGDIVTEADLEAIAQIYVAANPTMDAKWIHDQTISGFRQYLGKPFSSIAGEVTSPLPNPLEAVNDVAGAIAGIPAALGDVVIHAGMLMALLGLIGLGLYLVATSES